MKKFLTVSAIAALTVGGNLCGAAELAPAYLITAKETFRAYIVNAAKGKLLWKESPTAVRSETMRASSATIYFLEPASFTEAMELYKSRNYKDAKEAFAKTKKDFQHIRELKGNFSTLAGFYEIECARKLQDLSEVAALMEKFDGGPLTEEFDQVQLEINRVIWDAVRTKSWGRLDAIVRDKKWVERKLPGSLRVQIGYCHGLALEGINKPIEALNAYNTAFIADFGASERITKQAALNCLRILSEHEETKITMGLYGTEDYSDNSQGALYIKEGTALLKLWDKTLGGGEKVPDKYKIFLKYPPLSGGGQ